MHTRLPTHPHAETNPAPHGTKRFHIHEMRRIPVTISANAKAIIDSSTRQGRLLPQALSEFFGTLPDVRRVEVDLVDDRFTIDVKHAKDGRKHHRFYLAVKDITQKSELAGKGFDAAKTADELLKLYRAYALGEVV